MSETELVPYRVEHPSTIEPIDESVIPDCGREESDRLSIEKSRVDRQLLDLGFTRSTRVLKRCLLILGPLSLLPVVVAARSVGAISIVAASWIVVGCAFVKVVIATLASGIFCEPHDNKETRALRARQELLQERLESLRSLERLIGKQGEARKFLLEANAFNHDLERVADLECTEADKLMIRERRADILGRINDFRTKVLTAAPQPMLPPSGNPDRAS